MNHDFNMDSYIRLFEIYKSITVWSIIQKIYITATTPRRCFIWIGLIGYAVTVCIYFSRPASDLVHSLPFFASLSFAALAAVSFDSARKQTFSKEAKLYPDRLRAFSINYQYIRFLEFRKKSQNSGSGTCIQDALDFLEIQKQTEANDGLSKHPLVVTMVGVIGATLVAITSNSSTLLVAALVAMCMVTLLLGWVLQIRFGQRHKIFEFQRFLLWLKADSQPH